MTTFYPLWVGVANQKQAARVVANLHLFELPGGLQTSTNAPVASGMRPSAGRPMEMIAVKGCVATAMQTEADRITTNFLSMILKEFIQHNTIVEKYDVERRESEVVRA